MEVINRWVVAIESEDPATNVFLWNWMAICTVFLAFTNFLNFSWQVLPYSGSKGIFPAVEKQKCLRASYDWWRVLLHFPASWFRFIGGFSDTAIKAYPWVGMAITGSFCVITATATDSLGATVAESVRGLTSTTKFPTGQIAPFPVQIILLWASWFFHAIFSDLAVMPFPWHNVINESLLVLAMSWTTQLSAAYGGGTYPSLGVTAARVLSFRVLFGFGKTKFIGAELRDWKYIKGFLVGMPVPSPVGVMIYRWVPDWVYGPGYAFFFISECMLVFAYFAPSCWWRVVSCLITVKLMIAIMITGNFGNFNLLTAALCLAVPLPVTGRTEVITIASTIPWWYSVAAALSYYGALLHMIGGTAIMIPFNSWVCGGWHVWPALLQIPGVSYFNYVFEVLFSWRACQAYGVFPPNSSAIQRQVPLFEGSRDGKTWLPYRFNHQPTEANERNSFLPGIHPNLEFTTFYQIGAGFLQSSLSGNGCVHNFESRLMEEIAKNLAAGGDAADLFRIAPFPKTNPPKYVRIVQLVMFPEPKESPNWWKVIRTQQEIATFSAETRDQLMPKGWVNDPLVETEPGNWIWRQRTMGRKAEIAKVLAVAGAAPVSASKEDIQAFNDKRATAAFTHLLTKTANLSAEPKEFIQQMKRCEKLDEVVENRDRAQQYLAVPILQREIHREALLLADILITCGWPWYGENKPRMAELRKDGRWKTLDDEPFPITIFQLYLYGLYIMANPVKLPLTKDALEAMKVQILALNEGPNSWYRADTPVDPKQIHDGLRLVTGMYPRTLRQESSVCRRWSKLSSSKNQDVRGGDMVLPGYQMYWRALFQKALPFPSDAAAHGNAKLAATVPGNVGASWGDEWRGIFAFSDTKYEYEFHGFSVGDHRLPSAEKLIIPWENEDKEKKKK